MRQTLIAIALLLFAASAEAGQYYRSVELEWEPIQGAQSYEVEWVKGDSCDAPGASKARVARPLWKNLLPAGVFCVRVRAIGDEERPGEWTEYQNITVRPKPPATITSPADAMYEWESVPYAEKYKIEVVNSGGDTVYTSEIKHTEFTIPRKVLEDNKLLGQQLTVRVYTAVEGVPLSAPVQQNFSIAAMPTAIRRTNILDIVKLKPRERNLPNQPPAGAMPIDEAVDRFRITGEIPVIPDAYEWEKAQTPREIEVLRRRTIASSRVELIHQQERARAPDLKLGGGMLYGPYNYRTVESDVSKNKTVNSVGPRLSLSADFNQDRPWGAFLKFNNRFISVDGATQAVQFSTLSLGVEHHYPLDSAWNSVFFLGLGAEFSQYPFLSNETSSVDVFNIFMAGGVFDFGLRYEMDRDWALEGKVEVKMAPTQTFYKSFTKTKSQGAEVGLSALYRVASDFELKGGLALAGTTLTAIEGSQSKSTLIEMGASLSGQYRISPSEGRRLAAEQMFDLQALRLWEAHLDFPIASRSSNVVNFQNDHIIKSSSTTPIGIEASLKRKFTESAPWSVLAEGRMATGSSHYSVRGGYEQPLFFRKDMIFYVGVGPGYSQETGSDYRAASVTLQAIDVEGTTTIRKLWTDSIATQMEFGLGWPFSISYGSGTSAVGTNYFWNAGLGLGYRLTNALALWSGYRYRKLRLAAKSTQTLSEYLTAQAEANGTEAPNTESQNFQNAVIQKSIDYAEHAFKLGIEINW